ncbi:MAG: guanylate kinase [Pseudomonadota bacterium]
MSNSDPVFATGVQIERRGMMLVVSSPSGAGKTTLSRRLLNSDANLVMSVSATTRPAREGEVEGKDYFFYDHDRFEAEIEAGAFLEYARVFDHIYGTPRAPVEAWLSAGQDVLFDVDWQGAQQLRHAMRDDMASVFILPPSLVALEQRLKKRGLDAPEVIANRMAKAHAEISHWAEYDYVIVNDDLDASEVKLRAILTAERVRRSRQTGLPAFVRGMA